MRIVLSSHFRPIAGLTVCFTRYGENTIKADTGRIDHMKIVKVDEFSGEKLQVEKPKSVSVVVPFLNEEDSLVTLHQRIANVMNETDRDWNLIFVDDGSVDRGTEIAADIARMHENVTLLQFTRNFGKASALSAGMAHSKSDIIITMDADLQDDPTEIPSFLEKLSEGYDVVSGWKQKRNDPLGKTLPSLVFNRMTAKLLNVELNDINCGFKAYTHRATRRLNLYGELHRFTPALLHADGFRYAELPVKHHAREHGYSKYGTTRMIKGLLDLVTVKLITKYQSRPLHFFAFLGLPLLLLGLAAIGYLSILWCLGMGPIGTRPLLQIGILLTVTGVQILGIGLIAELVQATGLKEGDKYVIDKTISRGGDTNGGAQL
jgi:glycosyltransferase involved in cell wall biosynthesis